MNSFNLSEKSKNYYEENDIYEIFSLAEDYPNKIFDYLYPYIQNKIILDLGCGTGKFMQKFYKDTIKYYGLDLSEKQLEAVFTDEDSTLINAWAWTWKTIVLINMIYKLINASKMDFDEAIDDPELSDYIQFIHCLFCVFISSFLCLCTNRFI